MKKKNKLMLKTFFKVMFKNQEINSIIPQAYQESIYDINYQKLKEKEITTIFFDIDGTIAGVNNPIIPQKTIDLIARLKKEFNILLISNNKEERVKPVANILKVKYIFHACKPEEEAFEKALKLMNAQKENTSMIGDQILTDIVGANKCGIYSILVKQLESKNNVQTSLAHKLQKYLIKKLERKNLLKKEKFYMN